MLTRFLWHALLVPLMWLLYVSVPSSNRSLSNFFTALLVEPDVASNIAFACSHVCSATAVSVAVSSVLKIYDSWALALNTSKMALL